MALSTDPVYFPSLDQCLNGDQILLSWKLVASALQDSSPDRMLSDAVSKFLRDERVYSLIKDPSKAFEKPSPQTKSDFETRTAAINVTPTQNDRYDIKTIKEDALWLSKSVDINEVAALRIVTIEFQDRPQSHLCGVLSTQDVINLQQAVGADGSQANSLLASIGATDTVDADTIWSQFNTEASRRRRLLETYMSERRFFMLFLDNVLHTMLEHTFLEFDDARAASSKQLLRTTFGDDTDLTRLRHVPRERLLAKYMSLLPEYVESAENGPIGVLTEFDLQLDWLKTVLTETTHLMSLVFQLADLVEDAFLPAETVAAWFTFVGTYGFMDALQPADEPTAELLQPIKSLVCVISMKMLNLPRAVPFLDGEIDLHADEDSYIASEEVMKQIDETVINAANAGLVTAGPVVFTWTLITQQMLRLYYDRQERRDLQENRQAQEGFEREVQHLEARPGVGRRSSVGSIVSMETQPYDKFLTSVFGTSQQQQDLHRLEQLAMAVTAGGQMHNFLTEMAGCLGESHNAPFRAYLGARMRFVILGFLNFSFPVVGYISESISTFFSVLLAGRGYWDIAGKKPLPSRQDVVVDALNDPLTNQFYIQQVWLRWPYEFAPFTRLCKVMSMTLAESATSGLKNALTTTPTLTFHLPDPYWEFTGDENDLGRLELVRDVPLFSVLPSRKRLMAGEESFCIPAGVTGQLVSDTSRIIQVHYTHSTFALLGKRLETNLARESYDFALGTLDAEELAEAISLLATAIRGETAKALADNQPVADYAAAKEILQATRRELPPNKDIIAVITDTLDSYIDSDLVNLEASGVRVMSACLQFLDSVLPIHPNRVWSYLTRCDLLMSPSKAGRLSRITGTLELVDEQFDLLITIVNFFSSLVESAMAGAVQRKTVVKANGRAKDNELPWQGTSDKVLAQVNLSVAHTAVDIFENSVTWRFASEVHRSILLSNLVPTLNKLIIYSEGITNDDNHNTVTPFLKPAAQYIIDGFLSTSPSSLKFQPLLASMMVALGLPDSTFYQRRAELISKRQIAALEFATTLIRVANIQDKPTTAIEGQLLKCSALLARLCATSAEYKDPTLFLFGALAERISQDDSETPSLLGYLGPRVSRSFLQTISRLDKPFNRQTESKNSWAFFATIMRNGQHWMANCLLTGKTPREALGGDTKLSKLAPDSILKTALTRLRSIRTLPTSEILAILDLLTSAHNYWQWTVFASQDDAQYLDDLRAYLRKLSPTAKTARIDVGRACDHARIAAYIAEALAMHLYHLRKTGREKEFARELVADLDFYLREGVTVAGYNSSLHGNFSKNFAKQYSPFKLENFQRSLVSPRQLGSQYYYALDLSDKMLNFDPGWAGPRERNGFRNEMETANLNLSLVDAQVALFHAWEFLLLELSSCLSSNEVLINTQMSQVLRQCLDCNQTTQGPERIFLRITQSRANLALVILQRLPTSSMSPRGTAEILSIVWATVSSIENPFVPDQIQHWRTTLRMLYVALRVHRASTVKSSAEGRLDGKVVVDVSQGVLNILHRVVAQGFRSLVALAHDSETVIVPDDFALITAILQACLCLPAMDELSGEVLNIMISEDVGQLALSLFSWADKLAVKGDPLYGELSILFLLQLSSVPAIAEHLASEGLLAQLTSANLTSHIQAANVSPFADNIGAQRCYDIWAKGILPLLLNVLSAPGLGPNIATEVAYVLNQFPNLLASSVERIDAPGMSRTAARSANYVTLLGVSEINSLALLTRILTGYRSNFNHEIPEVSWDSATVIESVDYWLTTRKMLREKLLPLGQREADWRAMKTDVEGVSVLEQKAVSLLEAVKEVLSDDWE